VVTDTARPPATNTQKHIQDQLQYTAPLASAQCKYHFFTELVTQYLYKQQSKDAL